MDDALAQLGIGGIFAILMVRTVLDAWQKWQAMQTRKRESSRPGSPWRDEISELHKIVARTDEMGTPMLYRLLEQLALDQRNSTACLQKQTQILEQMVIRQNELHSAMMRTRRHPAPPNGDR